MTKAKQTTPATTSSATSTGAVARGTFANEAIYKLYIDIAGVLWGAAMVVAFYFNAVPWKTVITSFCLMVISLTPALAWDLLGTATISLHKLEESPYLLPALLAHLIGILFTIMWMRRTARMERIKEVTP